MPDPDSDQSDVFHRLAGQQQQQPAQPQQPTPQEPEQAQSADQSQGGGSIFHRLAKQDQNNPLTLNIPSGPGKTQQEYEQGFQSFANTAAKYAPGTLAAIGGILQPEFGLPMLGAVGAGALLGSGIEQGTQLLTGSPEAPQSLGEAGLRAGQELATQEAAELGGRAIAKPIEWGMGRLVPYAERLYQTALKPSIATGAEKAAELTATGLRERIPVSAKGYEMGRAKINALNQEIADKIATRSQQLGAVIDPKNVVKELEAKRPWATLQVNPEADIQALNNAKAEFLRQHTVEAPYTKLGAFTDPAEAEAMGSMYYPAGQGSTSTVQPMTLSKAQAIKQGTYQRLQGAYDELGTAKTEYQKALARGLKNDIVANFPELKGLNARDSSLIDLMDELEKHAVRATTGQGGMRLGTAAVGAMTGHPAVGATLGVMGSLYRDPVFRSRLAIALYRSATSRLPRRMITTGIHALSPNQPIVIHPGQWSEGGRVRNDEVDRLARRTVDRRAVLRNLGA